MVSTPALPRLDGQAGMGEELDDRACRSLWVAVIRKAMKDMAYASAKETQSALTPSEREKLQRIYELEAPESFFRGNWFEEICRNLGLSAPRIRSEILTRYEPDGDAASLLER
ncbi:MAG: hypothetical protein ACOC5E_01210 [Acidobacteriota bacterium]